MCAHVRHGVCVTHTTAHPLHGTHTHTWERGPEGGCHSAHRSSLAMCSPAVDRRSSLPPSLPLTLQQSTPSRPCLAQYPTLVLGFTPARPCPA